MANREKRQVRAIARFSQLLVVRFHQLPPPIYFLMQS
jgi:hypothetical protein